MILKDEILEYFKR